MTAPLIALGAAIIAALAGYACWLHYRLWQLKRRERSRATVALFEPPVPARGMVDREKSLFLLAEALLDDKMTHTEGCLRICAVASQLTGHDSFRRNYPALFTVADETAHIPILEDWHALSGDEQKRYDRERYAIEEKHRAAVIEAAKRLRASFTRH